MTTNELIEALRNELKEYGEMLALLDEQQEHVLARSADAVLDSVARVNAQAVVLQQVRAAREHLQRELARSVAIDEESPLFVIAQTLPEDYRPLLQALVNENNQLLGRVQSRAKQNHLLLSRCVDLMQRFIQSLTPGNSTTVYGGNGAVHATSAGYALYEAVG